MHPRDVEVGQLVRVRGIGLCTVMNFFAPAYIGVVVVDPKRPELQGEWRYLRGLDLEQAEVVG